MDLEGITELQLPVPLKLLQLSDESLSSSLVLITSLLYNLVLSIFLCNLPRGASNTANSRNLEL